MILPSNKMLDYIMRLLVCAVEDVYNVVLSLFGKSTKVIWTQCVSLLSTVIEMSGSFPCRWNM